MAEVGVVAAVVDPPADDMIVADATVAPPVAVMGTVGFVAVHNISLPLDFVGSIVFGDVVYCDIDGTLLVLGIEAGPETLPPISAAPVLGAMCVIDLVLVLVGVAEMIPVGVDMDPVSSEEKT